MKKIILSFLLFIRLSICNGQNYDSTTLGTFQSPFKIQVVDKETWKELGYFSYTPETNRIYKRGTYNAVFKWFVNEFFTPLMQISGVARNLSEGIASDGMPLYGLSDLIERKRQYDSVVNFWEQRFFNLK